MMYVCDETFAVVDPGEFRAGLVRSLDAFDRIAAELHAMEETPVLDYMRQIGHRGVFSLAGTCYLACVAGDRGVDDVPMDWPFESRDWMRGLEDEAGNDLRIACLTRAGAFFLADIKALRCRERLQGTRQKITLKIKRATLLFYKVLNLLQDLLRTAEPPAPPTRVEDKENWL